MKFLLWFKDWITSIWRLWTLSSPINLKIQFSRKSNLDKYFFFKIFVRVVKDCRQKGPFPPRMMEKKSVPFSKHFTSKNYKKTCLFPCSFSIITLLRPECLFFEILEHQTTIVFMLKDEKKKSCEEIFRQKSTKKDKENSWIFQRNKILEMFLCSRDSETVSNAIFSQFFIRKWFFSSFWTSLIVVSIEDFFLQILAERISWNPKRTKKLRNIFYKFWCSYQKIHDFICNEKPRQAMMFYQVGEGIKFQEKSLQSWDIYIAKFVCCRGKLNSFWIFRAWTDIFIKRAGEIAHLYWVNLHQFWGEADEKISEG